MTEITVNGMTCTSCATHVKDALEKIPGVNAAVVSYPESRAQVMADTAVSHNQLLAAIAALGYQGSIRVGVDRPAFRRHPDAIIHGNDRGVYGQQQAVHG